jgi:hypothetical protein
MALVLVGLRAVLETALGGATLEQLAALTGLVTAGFVAFMGLILLLGVTHWRELRGQFRRQPA